MWDVPGQNVPEIGLYDRDFRTFAGSSQESTEIGLMLYGQLKPRPKQLKFEVNVALPDNGTKAVRPRHPSQRIENFTDVTFSLAFFFYLGVKIN